MTDLILYPMTTPTARNDFSKQPHVHVSIAHTVAALRGAPFNDDLRSDFFVPTHMQLHRVRSQNSLEDFDCSTVHSAGSCDSPNFFSTPLHPNPLGSTELASPAASGSLAGVRTCDAAYCTQTFRIARHGIVNSEHVDKGNQKTWVNVRTLLAALQRVASV
jgi:hypothetical protein